MSSVLSIRFYLMTGLILVFFFSTYTLRDYETIHPYDTFDIYLGFSCHNT